MGGVMGNLVIGFIGYLFFMLVVIFSAYMFSASYKEYIKSKGVNFWCAISFIWAILSLTGLIGWILQVFK
jgi:hypothetical protein